jgi:hypothetical protein
VLRRRAAPVRGANSTSGTPARSKMACKSKGGGQHAKTKGPVRERAVRGLPILGGKVSSRGSKTAGFSAPLGGLASSLVARREEDDEEEDEEEKKKDDEEE